MIKLTKLILAFCLFFTLNSCGDDESSFASNDITGDWSIVVYDVSSSSSTTFSGTTNTISVEISAKNMEYEINFDGSNFTTSGSYDTESIISITGYSDQISTDSFRDISGSGTYTIEGDELMIQGSFFEFDGNGMPSMQTGDVQTMNYEINDSGELILSQEENTTTTDAGVVSTSSNMFYAKCIRK